MTQSNSYVSCEHVYCFAIFIGKPGDLCDDCSKAPSGDPNGAFCNGCVNDSTNEED